MQHSTSVVKIWTKALGAKREPFWPTVISFHVSLRQGVPTSLQSAVHTVYSPVQPRYLVKSLHTKCNTDQYGNEISFLCNPLQHLQYTVCNSTIGQNSLYCSSNIVYLFVWFIRVGVFYRIGVSKEFWSKIIWHRKASLRSFLCRSTPQGT